MMTLQARQSVWILVPIVMRRSRRRFVAQRFVLFSILAGVINACSQSCPATSTVSRYASTDPDAGYGDGDPPAAECHRLCDPLVGAGENLRLERCGDYFVIYYMDPGS